MFISELWQKVRGEQLVVWVRFLGNMTESNRQKRQGSDRLVGWNPTEFRSTLDRSNVVKLQQS